MHVMRICLVISMKETTLLVVRMVFMESLMMLVINYVTNVIQYVQHVPQM